MLANMEGSRIRYIVYQREICPTTGRLHLQGYLELRGTMRVGAVKAMFNSDTLSLRFRIGTSAQAADYCKKADTRADGCSCVEYGERSKRGERNDLNEIREAILARKSRLFLWDNYFGTMVRYNRGIRQYETLFQEQVVREKPFVTVVYGPTDLGKSKWCHTQTSMKAFWVKKSNSGVWWDGYDLHQDVIMDDFYGWMPWNNLLRLLDRYPERGDTKGGSVSLNSIKRIFITSNVHPNQWYSYGGHKKYAALERRIDILHHCDSVDYFAKLVVDLTLAEKE